MTTLCHKGTWESKWPGSKVGGASAQSAKEQCLPSQGWRAGLRLRPMSSDPKVRAVSIRPPPQDRTCVLLFWLRQSRSPETQLRGPSCPSAVESKPLCLLPSARNLAGPWPPRSPHLKSSTGSITALWEILVTFLREAAPRLPAMAQDGSSTSFGLFRCDVHRILKRTLGKDSGQADLASVRAP